MSNVISCDTVTNIIAYENGEFSPDETLEFFSSIIKSGQVWHLQGSYQRAALGFIDAGFIKTDGTILKRVDEE